MGGAIGWLILGGPLGVVASAAIGASDDDERSKIVVSGLLGCRMIVKVGGTTQVVFTYTEDMPVLQHEISTCSLYRPGDRLRIQELWYSGGDLSRHQRVAYGRLCHEYGPSCCHDNGEITP